MAESSKSKLKLLPNGENEGNLSSYENLRLLFIAGSHKEILELTNNGDLISEDFKILSLVVGSLAALGRVQEAQTLLDQFDAVISPDARVEARFYLSLSYCRRSNYQQCRKLLGQNLRAARKLGTDLAQHFAYQGVGFYRYFCGRFKQSLRAAEKSLMAAQNARYSYGRVLARDLLSHSQIRRGQITLGLANLKETRKAAKATGALGVARAIEAAELCYQLRFGKILPAEVADCGEFQEALLAECNPEDTYSQSMLLLEVSRFFCLKGRLDHAQLALNQARVQIYLFENRRHEIVLNIRYAEIHRSLGNMHEALNLLRNSRALLDSVVDAALDLELSGLEQDLVQRLGFHEKARELEARVHRLTLSTGEAVSVRMLRRKASTDLKLPIATSSGEDPIADLIDVVSRGDIPASTKEIVRTGCFGLLGSLLKLAPDASTIIFDLSPDSMTLYEHGRVFHWPHGLTNSMKKFLEALASGSEFTKDQLVTSLWGLHYHPLRHDHLLYNTVAKTRRLFEQQTSFDPIRMIEGGYTLSRTTSLIHLGAFDKVYKESGRMAVASRMDEIRHEGAELKARNFISSVNESLDNIRQMRAVKELETREYFDVQTYKDTFQVSGVTASRDLRALLHKGVVQRVGRARSTKYLLAPTSKVKIA